MKKLISTMAFLILTASTGMPYPSTMKIVEIKTIIKVIAEDLTTPHGHPLPNRSLGNRVFGRRMHPILKRLKMHNGVDISAKHGEKILAPSNGYVKTVERKGGYGLKIIIIHNKNLSTLYAHLSKAFVKEGDFVNRGDVIGLVGNSGLSTRPHLHFEIRNGNRPVNPENYINFTPVQTVWEGRSWFNNRRRTSFDSIEQEQGYTGSL